MAEDSANLPSVQELPCRDRPASAGAERRLNAWTYNTWRGELAASASWGDPMGPGDPGCVGAADEHMRHATTETPSEKSGGLDEPRRMVRPRECPDGIVLRFDRRAADALADEKRGSEGRRHLQADPPERDQRARSSGARRRKGPGRRHGVRGRRSARVPNLGRVRQPRLVVHGRRGDVPDAPRGPPPRIFALNQARRRSSCS
jgi:hypothetical protein